MSTYIERHQDDEQTPDRPVTIAGFTPVFDVIAQDPELGRTAALVFGKVWRYSQMHLQVCKAGRERMAKEIGLSVRSFERWLPKLVKAGYLRVTNPESKYHDGCTYQCTDKITIEAHLEARSQ